MPESPKEAFRQAVRASLAKLDTQIQDALRGLIEHKYPPEVFALAFEVFRDRFKSGFPVRAFFMDRSNTEHFVYEGGKATCPSPINPGLLEVDCVYGEELEEELEERAPESDVWEIASEELIQWFAMHWHHVGGTRFPLVATIAVHDSSKEFNLKSGLWQSAHAAFDV